MSSVAASEGIDGRSIPFVSSHGWSVTEVTPGCPGRRSPLPVPSLSVVGTVISSRVNGSLVSSGFTDPPHPFVSGGDRRRRGGGRVCFDCDGFITQVNKQYPRYSIPIYYRRFLSVSKNLTSTPTRAESRSKRDPRTDPPHPPSESSRST